MTVVFLKKFSLLNMSCDLGFTFLIKFLKSINTYNQTFNQFFVKILTKFYITIENNV